MKAKRTYRSGTYEGAPCVHGHGVLRYLDSRACVECHKANSRKQWILRGDQTRAKRRAVYATPEGRKDRKERNLFQNYGLTLDAYDAMRRGQGYSCDICDREEWEVGQLVVDHDHDTGAVRSLLCTGCNLALGGLRDDPVIAEKAAAYLRKHGKV